ncbi:MAG: hypothetical protein ACP5N7_06495 [Candidatus Pacearchaeota archaeon]
MKFCHGYIVKDVNTNKVHVLSRAEKNIADTYSVVREVTIAFTDDHASLAIRNTDPDRTTNRVDAFSRTIGRDVAEHRLARLLEALNAQESKPRNVVVRPKLHDFPNRATKEAINQFLTPFREELKKNGR